MKRKVSYSSMSTFNECGLKYKFNYIDKIPQKPKHFFSFGKSVHSALEYMYSSMACPDLDNVLESLDQAWVSEGYKDQAAEVKAKKDAYKMLTMYHAKHASGWVAPIANELKFDITVDHVRVTGFIDRIDIEGNGLHVLDYKTGQSLDVERINADEQLTMYQMAVEELGMGRVEKLSLYHVPTLQIHSCGRHSEDLVVALRAKIKETAGAIDAQKFEPNPSDKACSWCDHKVLCSVWQE
jgi:RecB family exonuclease